MPLKRRLAKSLFWLGGQLSRIKTPQRTYRLVSIDPFKTERLPIRWSSTRWSAKLYKASMRLDWDHWDHWALVHSHCGADEVCPVCGGLVCDPEPEDGKEGCGEDLEQGPRTSTEEAGDATSSR